VQLPRFIESSPLLLSASILPLIVAIAIAILLALERMFPLRKQKQPLGRRLFVNSVVGVLAIAAALMIVRPIASWLLQEVSQNGWGLTGIVRMPVMLQAIVTFLLLDLSFYYWHRANHAWPFLWRFHNVHHVDPDLDVSTSFRFHFLEIAFSAAFRALQVVVIGGEPWMFVVYESAFQLNTLFQHSNVRLPITIERWMVLILVTPRMHGIHHSRRFYEVNSNWSSVFSGWDRLHGTLNLNVPQSAIDVGVPGYSAPRDNRILELVLMPLRPQRSYWSAEWKIPYPVQSDAKNALPE
jgi:sterol desaturase/sphingolipid hydroxylase (fatty acid hydroxylase superfamily)